MIAGIGLHPVLVFVGPLAENFLAHHRNAEHLPDKVNHLLRPGEPVQITVDDDAVETVIYKNEKIPEKPDECVHGNISYRRERHRWAVERLNADLEKSAPTERISRSPKRSTTSAAGRPNTTV